MKKLSKEEMKNVLGGTNILAVMGTRVVDGFCYYDMCSVNLSTGEVSGCQCDIAAGLNSPVCNNHTNF